MVEAGFTLLRPWWLAGVIGALLLGFLLRRRATALGDWERAVDPHLLAAMTQLGAVVKAHGRKGWAAALGAGSVALALTGPALQQADTDRFRNLDATVVVVDLSRSLAGGGNLTAARFAAQAVAAAGTRQVALVVYAGDAFLASNFSSDRDALASTIAVLDGETVPVPGSRPARALALSRELLEQAGIVAGDVVLISDGGGFDAAALREVARLREEGHRLDTIYVPTEELPPGAPRPSRATLDAAAAETGGVSADVADPLPVIAQISNGVATRLAATDYVVLAWADLGRFLLIVSLLPALLLFRRGAA
jgi:Ca-activated chloride channel family protein